MKSTTDKARLMVGKVGGKWGLFQALNSYSVRAKESACNVDGVWHSNWNGTASDELLMEQNFELVKWFKSKAEKDQWKTSRTDAYFI